ncbi:MAG TPA: glutamine-hydrolyzing GMP synthase [Candidatus Saccharimonadales bacterium]|nr:glutamine-hydrolyzing GMP synthase [Candidatus Saccharimonadales bacterium]
MPGPGPPHPAPAASGGAAARPRPWALVLDFGSQYVQLIARRLREAGVYAEIHPWHLEAEAVQALAPDALVISGSPASVAGPGAPRLDPAVLGLGLPVLGICFGMQASAHALGGRVRRAHAREYGRARFRPDSACPLFEGLPPEFRVWMSHADSVEELPAGLVPAGRTESCAHAASWDPGRRVCLLQFHPEVTHTEHGPRIFENFVRRVAGLQAGWTMAAFLDREVPRIRERVGRERVLLGLSGGVDSSVVGALLGRAVDRQAVGIFVDHGLLRADEGSQVLAALRGVSPIEIHAVDARARFLERLQGVADPEQKRRIIGEEFVRVFEAEAARLGGFRFLAQGTLYPDVIESAGWTTGPTARIKTHHNVGGLPADLRFELLEPLRSLFKDEVRALGLALGLPRELVFRHPFPGPGLAVRILGPVTPAALETLREADRIFVEGLRRRRLYDKVWQAFAVLLPVQTVGVMGDERTYEQVVALRAVTSEDGMTADWAKLPRAFLDEVATHIVNRVPGVNRVVYDISSKPPATIEWE